MQTINNRMTATQVADLFSLAVQLQVKAEESDDRDTAILAYSTNPIRTSAFPFPDTRNSRRPSLIILR
jgi:hypothetical protein